MLATNQILHKGRYRVINSFGQDETGGMYEAYDTVSNTNVVLRESVGKLGKITTSSHLEAINKAFDGSAKVLKEIRHESLVSVQDYFSEIGCQYLVLEAVTGFDLAKFLEPNEQRPSLLDFLSWADELLAAVGYLHQLSPPVIHTDITPENVKLTSNKKVKLLTAMVATNQGSGDIMPVPGQNIGNDASHYRPLEQLWPGLGTTSQRVILNHYDERSAGLLIQPPDARSDLYSIGASLYHVITGTQPTDALDRSITILDGSHDPLQRPDDVDNSIPSEISDLLMKALEIRREDRFDSAVIMRQALRTAVVSVGKSEGIKAGRAKTPTSVEAKNAEPPTEIDSAEIQLELHRSMSGERQRELRDEEARLEEEQNRIHQKREELEAEKTRQLAEMERLELEAEQARKRVEQERKRLEEMEAEKERGLIAQRLAELEAEQVRQRAEEESLAREEAEQEARCAEVERLEREAKEERIRAEERLLELKAEQERKRAEQKRHEAEAGEERKRAEQRLMELSGSNLDVTSQSNEDYQDLLELEPVEKEKAKAMGAASATGTMKKDARKLERTSDFMISDLEGPKAFNARIPVIVCGVLIAVVGGWMFMSSSVPETKPSAAAVTTSVQTDQAAQKPASDEQSIAVQEKPAEPDQSVTSMPAADVTIDDRSKRAQLNSAQNKQKKPASSPAKTSPQKKVVTVDDLINDN